MKRKIVDPLQSIEPNFNRSARFPLCPSTSVSKLDDACTSVIHTAWKSPLQFCAVITKIQHGMSTPVNKRKRGAPSPGSSQHGTKMGFSAGGDRKRLKVQDARTIAAQSSESALKSGQLDINAFVRSREFEIQALEDAIFNSKYLP